MRFTAITSVLLLGVTVVNAIPTEYNGVEFSALEDRSLKVEYSREPPKEENCPATNNGPNRDYGEHKYTNNQLKAAFIKGATLQADGKQLDTYPHKFGNREQLEFECGEDKMEYPLQLDGKTYNGGDVGGAPDRLIYEYKEKKGKLQVKFCGVIRHGPGADFINCHH